MFNVTQPVLTLMFGIAFSIPCLAANPPYPSKVVKIIVPTGPGTASDATARYLSDGLSKKFGKTFIVENRPGASATIATAAVHRAAPDGHTLLLTYSTHYINQWSLKLDYDALDFMPLAQLNKSPIVLSVGVASPYHSVEELVESARSRPGKLSFASVGGVSQIAGAYFLKKAGIQINSVLYKDPTQSLLDTANGLADMSFTGLTAPLPFVHSGKLRVLGVSTAQRDSNLPGVPAIAESGVPGYEFASNVIMLAPPRTPKDIVKQISEAVGEIALSTEFKNLCKVQGCTVDYLDSEQLATRFPQELEKWKTLVDQAGLTAK
ncbi:Bug family tripartite tricarboxylate transporter substrate binding protein [Advenella mimigardefordensis]|uniref:Putative Bug-like extracytoplasmic solute binding receptor, TTT family n=1 Tax=Advenella mimigardefordensis (strain DSM 17166 / LMG 22922 / DPN7) TaxID=1247726 RepID=W0PEY1_ADVMD|nr:tripartite tricarboxylate transporter substrate binding protein [Advenella mimigardefordensis]AHG64102.1 putative Bug-like extracytoplasmic solute binding receptor, TTT family [Advenella mimigardefordensis DPN7]